MKPSKQNTGKSVSPLQIKGINGQQSSSNCCQANQLKERKGKERKRKERTDNRSSKKLSLFTGHSPATSTKELLNEEFVLRMHSGEFENFCNDVRSMIPNWEPTLKDFKTDLRKLVYAPFGKRSDEKKRDLMYDLMNVTGEKMNWGKVLVLAIKITKEAPGIKQPYKFIMFLLKHPYRIMGHGK